MAKYILFHLERRFYQSGQEGVIESANYPRNYGPLQNYYWRISAPQGKRIEVTFDDVDIEYSRNCDEDFLKVYDSSDATGDVLKTYCGSSKAVSFKSSGRYLYFHFKSDAETTRKGFRMYWKSFDNPTSVVRPTVFYPEGKLCL